MALLCGVVCHVSFALGIGAMVAGIYTGMQWGRGTLHGWQAVAYDALLLVQFAVLHSFLLTQRGGRWLARMVPAKLGRDLATTTFATVASWQLILTFAGWAPFGAVWWEPHGWLRAAMTVIYGAAWLFLLCTMADAGLATQTGFLGWGAVVRNRVPQKQIFTAHGTFRYMRQPIYVAFTLTLWTGPVWTADHLLLALIWTAYCVLGPRLKERRYVGYYGDRFREYQQRVPYWLPALRRRDLPGSL